MNFKKISNVCAAGVIAALLFVQAGSVFAGETTVLQSGGGKDFSKGGGGGSGDTGNFDRFPFRISAAVRAGYDDNVLTSTFQPQKSWFLNAAILASYDFGSPRTALSLQVGTGITYYFDRPTSRDYDINASVAFNLTHKATPRLTLALNTYATYQNEPQFNNPAFAVANRRSGSYFFTADKFTATYQWAPRFATATFYSFVALRYENSAIAAFEDRNEHTIGNEFRFLLTPTTTLIAEYRFMWVNYDNGLRDSESHFFLAGVDHTFNPRTNMSIRAGAQVRDYDFGATRTEPYFEGTLNYAIGRRTTASVTARYSIEEPDVLSSPSRTTFRTGAQLRYGITPRLAMSVSAFYQHDNNEGTTGIFGVPSFEEDAYDIGLGLRYVLTRNLALEAGYNHTEVVSDVALREYSRNRYFMGVTFAF